LEAAVDAAEEDIDPAAIFAERDDKDREKVDPRDVSDHRRRPRRRVGTPFYIARWLGYTPRQIHRQARGLFGAEPPCEHDHADAGTCPYSEACKEAADAENPHDLLVGSYTHPHVDSV
jgi:hypothetical protein